MMTLHIFTEEPSAKKVFDNILPKLLPETVSFRVYPHQGKQDLEKALKDTVPTISKIPGSKIIITRDQDSEDCKSLKENLKGRIESRCECDFKIRIACRELESWFLGDLEAIKKAYPRFNPEQYQNRADLRNVDNIINPDKYLLKIIPEFKKRTSLPKLEVAESVSQYLDLDANKSTSFNHTIEAVQKLTNNN